MNGERHECSTTVFGERVRQWQCVRAGVVERAGKWYCRQHDPEARQARAEKREAARRVVQQREDAVEAEGRDVAARLGVAEAQVYYSNLGPLSRHGYRRYLVISFEECLRLAAALEDANDAAGDARVAEERADALRDT